MSLCVISQYCQIQMHNKWTQTYNVEKPHFTWGNDDCIRYLLSL